MCKPNTHTSSVCPGMIQICHTSPYDRIELCVPTYTWKSRYQRGDSCGACIYTEDDQRDYDNSHEKRNIRDNDEEEDTDDGTLFFLEGGIEE